MSLRLTSFNGGACRNQTLLRTRPQSYLQKLTSRPVGRYLRRYSNQECHGRGKLPSPLSPRCFQSKSCLVNRSLQSQNSSVCILFIDTSNMNLAIGISSKQNFASSSSDMPFVSRVTIKDILCDRSPKPYTLNAFMIFLTQNHCIETLDFIIDAEAYCEIYQANRTSPDDKNTSRDPMLIGKQWERLMATYICLESPSEVNLPSCIRDPLLAIVSDIVSSPSPEQLTSAIDHAYEILTENVLVPFIRNFHLAENHDMYEKSISTWTAVTDISFQVPFR